MARANSCLQNPLSLQKGRHSARELLGLDSATLRAYTIIGKWEKVAGGGC